jgi:hypothetical protein
MVGTDKAVPLQGLPAAEEEKVYGIMMSAISTGIK